MTAQLSPLGQQLEAAIASGELSSTDFMHPFERAGLGVAPFQFVGAENKAGTCHFCFRPLASLFHIQDVNGKIFHVGCDCVKKVDSEMFSSLQVAKKDLARERKWAREQAEREANNKAIDELLTPSMIAKLKAERHPCISSLTAFDYVQWRRDNWTNPLQTLRYIRQFIDG